MKLGSQLVDELVSGVNRARSSTKFSCNSRSSEGYSGSEEVLSGLQVKVVFKSLPE
jgi:hypothetical protein